MTAIQPPLLATRKDCVVEECPKVLCRCAIRLQDAVGDAEVREANVLEDSLARNCQQAQLDEVQAP